MWNFIILFLALCSCVCALTEEELKMEFTKLVMKCNKDSEVDMLELVQLQSYVIPTKTATKCVLACAYKAAEVMNAQGQYDIGHAYKVAELMKNGDEKRLVNAKKMADLCVKVNDMQVSDGEKGCDRAALIFKCTVENAPKHCSCVASDERYTTLVAKASNLKYDQCHSVDVFSTVGLSIIQPDKHCVAHAILHYHQHRYYLQRRYLTGKVPSVESVWLQAVN